MLDTKGHVFEFDKVLVETRGTLKLKAGWMAESTLRIPRWRTGDPNGDYTVKVETRRVVRMQVPDITNVDPDLGPIGPVCIEMKAIESVETVTTKVSTAVVDQYYSDTGPGPANRSTQVKRFPPDLSDKPKTNLLRGDVQRDWSRLQGRYGTTASAKHLYLPAGVDAGTMQFPVEKSFGTATWPAHLKSVFTPAAVEKVKVAWEKGRLEAGPAAPATGFNTEENGAAFFKATTVPSVRIGGFGAWPLAVAADAMDTDESAGRAEPVAAARRSGRPHTHWSGEPDPSCVQSESLERAAVAAEVAAGVAREKHEENEKRLRRNRMAKEARQRKKWAQEDVATDAAMAADPGMSAALAFDPASPSTSDGDVDL